MDNERTYFNLQISNMTIHQKDKIKVETDVFVELGL